MTAPPFRWKRRICAPCCPGSGSTRAPWRKPGFGTSGPQGRLQLAGYGISPDAAADAVRTRRFCIRAGPRTHRRRPDRRRVRPAGRPVRSAVDGREPAARPLSPGAWRPRHAAAGNAASRPCTNAPVRRFGRKTGIGCQNGGGRRNRRVPVGRGGGWRPLGRRERQLRRRGRFVPGLGADGRSRPKREPLWLFAADCRARPRRRRIRRSRRGAFGRAFDRVPGKRRRPVAAPFGRARRTGALPGARRTGRSAAAKTGAVRQR